MTPSPLQQAFFKTALVLMHPLIAGGCLVERVRVWLSQADPSFGLTGSVEPMNGNSQDLTREGRTDLVGG
jgi:hypothetical protein